MSILRKILHYARENELSDLHLRADQPMAIRVDGEVVVFEGDLISGGELLHFIETHLSSPALRDSFEHERDADLAIEIEEFRFRANFYHTSHGVAAALRKIETVIPTMEKLGLPEVIDRTLQAENGLILVTGPTGSGKSTSLAAMVDRINRQRHGNIITIEDPIEYVHLNRNCIVSQREVGRDTISFARALRASLREDPDIILVGEMRDRETIQLALTAAETGHLVFGTLHTSGAPNTVNRIIDVFPPAQQDQVRAQLSQSLRVVMTQRLHRRRDGSGRAASFEIMMATSAVRNLIREQKIHQLYSVMQTSRDVGMITMEQSIQELVSNGVIDLQSGSGVADLR